MSKMSTKTKVFLGFGVYILVTIIIVIATGWHRTSNDVTTNAPGHGAGPGRISSCW